MKYVPIILLMILSNTSHAQDTVVFRCTGSDGVYFYTLDKKETVGLTDCQGTGVTDVSDWTWLGSYGADKDIWKYKYFDDKRPADKLWVRVYPQVMDADIKVATVLFGFKCSTKQYQTLQLSELKYSGEVKSDNRTQPFNYAAPDTSGEDLLKIACKKPTK